MWMIAPFKQVYFLINLHCIYFRVFYTTFQDHTAKKGLCVTKEPTNNFIKTQKSHLKLPLGEILNRKEKRDFVWPANRGEGTTHIVKSALPSSYRETDFKIRCLFIQNDLYDWLPKKGIQRGKDLAEIRACFLTQSDQSLQKQQQRKAFHYRQIRLHKKKTWGKM